MPSTKAFMAAAIGAIALAATSAIALAASPFAGEWSVKDTAGKSFNITLSPDGTAKANLNPSMVGTWKEAGNTAVISWKSGWTTKIAKTDGHYTHMGYGPGQSPSGKPTNSSDAQKLK